MPMRVGTARIAGRSVPCTDATSSVTLHRSYEDIKKSKRGNVRECADARCGVRNRRQFPHAFHGIVVYTSRAYVIDKIDPKTREPLHVIRYSRTRKDIAAIKKFDAAGPMAILPGEITLRAVYHSIKAGTDRKRADKAAKGRGKGPKPKAIITHKGEARRIETAAGYYVAV